MTKNKEKKTGKRTWNHLSITLPKRIWQGFVKYRKTVEMPTDPAEIEKITPSTYDHQRTGVGRPVSLLSRNKVLFYRMLEAYESHLSGENNFIVDGKVVNCSCGQTSRKQQKEPTVTIHITTVGELLKKKFKSLLAQRNPAILTQRQGRGKSAPSLLSAALLTYASEIEKRPQIFCDTCGNPVNGKFPYADPRLQAPVYLFTPWDDGHMTYMQYGHKKTEILIKRGHLNVSYSGSAIAKLVSKIEHDKNFTEEALGKALSEINPLYKVKKVYGEGLVQLQSGLYLVSCPCQKPEFL